jgi:hypothetical protein
MRASRVKSYQPQPSKIMIVSSAYWRTEKSLEECKGMGKLRAPWYIALLMMECRRSAARTRRRGERLSLS